MGRLEIGLFLPHAANVDSMDMDEFLTALARAQTAHAILRDLVAAAVSKAVGGEQT